MRSDKKTAILISLVLLASALALVLPVSADSGNQEAFFERGTIFKQAHLKHADFDRGHLHSTDERSNLYGTEMGIQEVNVQDAQLGNGYYFEVYP